MSPSAGARRDVQAAGAVVLRKGAVLLVHRPRYDDWSFPKGKLDRGELAPAAAVREVEEETGLRIRLGPPLRPQRYPNGRVMKTVSYWHGRVRGDHDVGGYLVNDEIDEVAWVPVDKAQRRLTYTYDRRLSRRHSAARGAPSRSWCCATVRPTHARPGGTTTGSGRC